MHVEPVSLIRPDLDCISAGATWRAARLAATETRPFGHCEQAAWHTDEQRPPDAQTLQITFAALLAGLGVHCRKRKKTADQFRLRSIPT